GLGSPLWGFRQDNLEAIKTVHTHIKRLQKALKQTPKQALFLLFAPAPEDDIPSDAAQKQVIARVHTMTAMLVRLRARCDALLRVKPGTHAGAGYRQRWVAEEAWHLMQRHGMQPTSGIATSVYGRVAGLLYEAGFNKYGKDIERGCKSVLAQVK